jgi:transposase
MELTAPVRRRGTKNYTKEFREMVAAQANDPTRSIAEVAHEHGLNANMVAKWRRERARTHSVPQPSAIESFLPVHVQSSPKVPSAVVVERGAVRVLLRTVLVSLRDAQ